MANFATIAKKATTLSQIMEDREKMTVEELVEKYDTVTIVDIDFISYKKGKDDPVNVWVFVTAEEPDKFIFGGAIFTNICQQWLEAYEGDYTSLRADYQLSGGVKFQLTRIKTGNGRDCTAFKVIE